MSKGSILDPMWITKKNYIDSEYFGYILLAARQKYLKALQEGDHQHFYEIMFHYLNLNNLVLDGNMFNFKMKPSWKNSRIIQISKELSFFYDTANESGETVKQANEVLRDLAVKYLTVQAEIFDIKKLNMYYVNSHIQLLHDIYIILNINGEPKYEIWRLRMDRRFSKAYDFARVHTLDIKNIEETLIKDKIMEINNPDLNKMHPDVNLIFCICKDKDLDLAQIADSIKNTVLLNKLMGNDNRFDPNLIENALEILLDEKILPFKLSEEFI